MSATEQRNEKLARPGLHVLPTYGREHETSRDCWCEPEVDPVTLGDAYDQVVWLHKDPS